MHKNLSSDQKLLLAHYGTLIKGLAHNINTPLSTVFGRNEMVKIRLEMILKSSPSEEIEKCLKDVSLIIDNSHRIHEIVDHITQEIIKNLLPDTVNINIGIILNDVLGVLNSDMFFKHSIEKEFNLQENIPLISGKYMDFSLSFLEILENSKESMKDSETKKLKISVSLNNSSIEVIFKDTGSGIKDEQLRHINTCMNSPSEKEDLESGLMRVGRLMKPYCAKFSIDSTDSGTSFKISIPV